MISSHETKRKRGDDSSNLSITVEDLAKLKAQASSVSRTSVPTLNPYTGTPFTPRYWELWRKRTQLPVWDYREKFMEILNNHQTLTLV